jgi:hypothetical protein
VNVDGVPVLYIVQKSRLKECRDKSRRIALPERAVRNIGGFPRREIAVLSEVQRPPPEIL